MKFIERLFPFAPFLPLFILILYFFHPIPFQGPNVDLGHHLLLGKIIVETGSVPHINLISYTHPEYEFVNSQWLAEVVLYVWHQALGENGLILLAILLVASSFGLLFFLVGKRASVYALFVSSLLYIQLMVDRTEVKPELFSWVFMSLFVFILYQYRSRYTKWIFLLIPLILLWVNFHIYYFVGCVLLVCFLIDLFFSEKRKFTIKLKTLGIVTVGSFLATFINPYFAKGALYPLYVLNEYGYDVIENRNFFEVFSSHGNATFYYFFALVVLLWIFLFWFRKSTSLLDYLLATFFTFFGFYAVRNFPVFIFGTLLLFAVGMDNALASLAKVYGEKAIKTVKICLVVVVLVLVIVTAKWSIDLHGFGLGYRDVAHDATQFFKTNKLVGPIYNNYNIGNYLQYRLYPQERVFVDGNPEEYPREFFEKVYIPSEQTYSGFLQADQKYNFNIIFYEHVNQTLHENPVLLGIVKNKDWRMIYLSSSIVMFAKNNDQNREVIKKYALTESNIKINEKYLTDTVQLGQLSNFFRVVGWYGKMVEIDIMYLQHDPTNCTALRHVAVVMRQTNNINAPEYVSRFAQNCMN